ncbi:hypothetical protein PG990_013453 [Apiospora arundinis]
MIEPATCSAALLGIARFLAWIHELGEVPADIRKCLDLVRRCHEDVQFLIAILHENQHLLKWHPQDLGRVHLVIGAAVQSLQDVQAIVEKSRPEAHNGRTNIFKRMTWTCFDKHSFHKSESLVACHHRSVQGELTYVRALSLSQQPTTPNREGGVGMSEELGLFMEMMDGLNLTTHNTQATFTETHSSTPDTSIHVAAIRTTTTSTTAASRSPLNDVPVTSKARAGADSGSQGMSQRTTAKDKPSDEEDGLALAMWDFAVPVVQNNTSINIQKTVVNAPINLVINMNGGSAGGGSTMTAQIANETQAAVEAGLRDAFGGSTVNLWEPLGEPLWGPETTSLTKQQQQQQRQQRGSRPIPSNCAELDGIPVNTSLHRSIHEMPGDSRRI